jgi:ABC-type glycerol-3-phosphate transport system substrate-binding protein
MHLTRARVSSAALVMTLVLAGTSLAACGGSSSAKKSPTPTETLYHPVAPAGPLPRVKHLHPAN